MRRAAAAASLALCLACAPGCSVDVGGSVAATGSGDTAVRLVSEFRHGTFAEEPAVTTVVFSDIPYEDLADGSARDGRYLHIEILWRPRPGKTPIETHSESRSMGAALLMAQMFDKPIHIAHISLKEEILVIKEAKQQGIKVTCEVCPHHLFLADGAIPLSSAGNCCEEGLPDGRSQVRPRLATAEDAQALWQNLEWIDCFATDHAPHTLEEKDGPNPPPGFPGVETMLPLLYTAVREGRMSLEQLVEKCVTNPRRIFGLPEQAETWVEVDETDRYEIKAAELHSRCGWTPFENWQVTGRVRRVVLRGTDVYKDGKVLAQPGFGRDVRAVSTAQRKTGAN